MIRVAIADDHQIVLDGIRSIIAGGADMEVVAEASNGVELLRYLEAVNADIVLVDLDMPKKDGFG